MHYLEWVVRIICAMAALSIIYRRLYTLFYVSIRYCRDGTSTAERLHSPHLYEGRALKGMDKFNVILMSMVPDIISRTDFRKSPYPYGLWEGTRVFTYLRKVTVSSFVSVSVLLGIALDVIDVDYKWFVFGYFCFFGISVIFCRSCEFSHFLRRIAHRRFPICYISIKHLIKAWTFNLVVEGDMKDGPRNLGFLLVSVIGAIVMFLL